MTKYPIALAANEVVVFEDDKDNFFFVYLGKNGVGKSNFFLKTKNQLEGENKYFRFFFPSYHPKSEVFRKAPNQDSYIFIKYFEGLVLDMKKVGIIEKAFRKICTDWSVKIKSLDDIIFERNVNHKVSLLPSQTSDGIRNVLSLLITVASAPKHSYVLLDEPEATLHPACFRQLIEWIYVYAFNSKLIIYMSTHSPFLLDYLAGRSGLKILGLISEFKTNKNPILDSGSRKSKVNSPSQESSLITMKTIPIGDNIPLPLLFVIADERPILLCEGTYGSYDIKILERIFDPQKIDIQPSGSCSNIIHRVRAVDSTGKVIFGILDRDRKIFKNSITNLDKSRLFFWDVGEIENLFWTRDMLCALKKEKLINDDQITSFLKAIKTKLIERKGELLLEYLEQSFMELKEFNRNTSISDFYVKCESFHKAMSLLKTNPDASIGDSEDWHHDIAFVQKIFLNVPNIGTVDEQGFESLRFVNEKGISKQLLPQHTKNMMIHNKILELIETNPIFRGAITKYLPSDLLSFVYSY